MMIAKMKLSRDPVFTRPVVSFTCIILFLNLWNSSLLMRMILNTINITSHFNFQLHGSLGLLTSSVDLKTHH